jgi:superfamily II DNA or RNA helicase
MDDLQATDIGRGRAGSSSAGSIAGPRAPSAPNDPASQSSGQPEPRTYRSSRSLVADARNLRSQISVALATPDRRRRAARATFEIVRDDTVREQLDVMPLSRLKETTQGRLRLSAIEAAGYRTVGAAARAGVFWLEQLDGVGPQTASRVVAAAHQVEQAMRETVRVRFDPDARPPMQADLLGALLGFDVADRAIAPLREDITALAESIGTLIEDATKASSRLKMFFAGSRRRDEARQAADQLDNLMNSLATRATRERFEAAQRALTEPARDAGWLWRDYEDRPIAYNGLLIEVGELAPDAEASQGFIPAEIAARVRDQPLDLSNLKVSLRGYQAFGAKFALVQGRTIVGDEMGLGKTIEALAVICHLRAQGQTHFLVVCPASVLVNWAHEIRSHTDLSPYRLHGMDRARNLRAWEIRGGVAVTTYDSLRSIAPPERQLGMLVVDEAHYVKNPGAQRSKAVRSWAQRTARVLFLTGTPMENHVEEFRSLVGYLQPEIASRVKPMDSLAGASRFREAVAPVYLRRNQEDVLDELPPRIESEEWVELDGPDLDAYRRAVASGNFMAMRRAAYAPGTTAGSAKLARLAEIVDEAASNNRKVVVFSFFLDVLHAISTTLGTIAIGPLTGSIPPAKRQAMVDEFTAHKGPTVLVSQIQAGGVGLNIQAASVVIITEPQWKPTIEDQAIARCHRMGQVRTVDVHRLLAEDSVDQRMLEILATKAVLFDEYARRSQLKELTADAVDVSDLQATQQTASQAEAERRIVEIERKRLRLESESDSNVGIVAGS